QGMPYYAMEYLSGGTLTDRLQGETLKPSDVATLVAKVARAAHAAHVLGIVHRDIKPWNVMFDEHGEPKLVDFGLAKRLEGDGISVPGTVMGTPAYMAPEQARGDSEITPAVDVYALGCVLYQTLSGRPPFKGVSVFDVIQKIMFEHPVSLRQVNPAVSRDLE